MKRTFLLLTFLPGCAGFDVDRSVYVPAAAGAATGYLARSLSPNQESKALNTLVFGALGLGAGLLAERILFPKNTKEIPTTLKERELGRVDSREFVLPSEDQKLPKFVKDRLTPIVIEEYMERDSISEDGSLREPHKVWRIKKQPELVPRQNYPR